jgi:hypothetical protein
VFDLLPDPALREADRMAAQAEALDEAATLVTTCGTTVAAAASLLALAEHRRARSKDLRVAAADRIRDRFDHLCQDTAQATAQILARDPALPTPKPPASTAWITTGTARRSRPPWWLRTVQTIERGWDGLVDSFRRLGL